MPAIVTLNGSLGELSAACIPTFWNFITEVGMKNNFSHLLQQIIILVGKKLRYFPTISIIYNFSRKKSSLFSHYFICLLF